MSDLINRADAIEAVCRTRCGDKAKGCPAHSCLVIEEFDALPSADAVHGEDNEIIKAIHTINNFLDTQGVFLATSTWRAKDGTILTNDWGYFDDGMRAIEKYLKGGAE